MSAIVQFVSNSFQSQSVAMPLLDLSSGVPLSVQLSRQIRQFVIGNVWSAGSAAPSVRALAVNLGINPNTAARVYRQLEEEGFLRMVPGGGTFVAAFKAAKGAKSILSELQPEIEALVENSFRMRAGKKEVFSAIDWAWERHSDVARKGALDNE